MPIYQTDPWRVQFFENVPCPNDVIIPTKDWEAWTLYPRHRWIYDKLAVALSQGLDAAPHGVIPPRFPVFSKPMMNLRSMGAGSLPIPDIETYRASLNPGHLWCTLLTGAHVSTDAAIVNGIIEAHLRFADQWPDLYGPGWVEALVRLYAEGTWIFDDSDRKDGYSV